MKKLSRRLALLLIGIACVLQAMNSFANTSGARANTKFSDLEDQLQMARRYYNASVRDLNVAVEQFPSNVIAGSFGFKKADFFQIENAADRQVPKVAF